ncbi:hypothetical protein LTR08_003033 [Meristemomyces frigidus]|nr:hypothetical protein LTR08_003033 [Meristemomyces frigidus]
MGLAMFSNQSVDVPQVTARHHFMVYRPRAHAAFQHQQFFFEQKEKLSALLNAIGRDARTATTYQAGADYHELTTVVTQLLEEAQMLSRFTFDQVQRCGVVMQPFAEKVLLVESVALEVRARAVVLAKPASRKRGRDMDDEDEADFAVKRYRGVEQHSATEAAYCGSYADKFMRNTPWSQPTCE